jgi:hypothetical protein
MAEQEKWTTKELGVFIVAVACIVGLSVFIIYLIGQTTLAEPQWQRLVYLLNGVEAVAFGAAGYLFGKEVHRQRAETAEKEAKDAKADANHAKEVASASGQARVKAETQARALVSAISAKLQTDRPAGSEYESFGGKSVAPKSDLAELKDLADQLFRE